MIKILSKTVAGKIAAGEVVDRPLSIIKELVENSIDACATTITVEIEKGGKSYIRVTDDGLGIPSEEAELAFNRHATSKIVTDSDLNKIKTLGFRGEALASITAVSRTELLTKTREQKMGTMLTIEGSIVLDKKPTGCPDGTTIVVRDLFYNTPARLKFMKSNGTESGVIIDFVSQMALAYPNIKFKLINNGTMLFSTLGKGDRYKAILTIYSKEIGSSLIPLKYQRNDLIVEGYISSPGNTKTSRRNQIFFVNGRVINSKLIEQSVKKAYADKLFEGRHPIVFLFLHVDPSSLDVNIHPNKREVRFNDETFVEETVYKAIRNGLLTKESIPEVNKKNANTFRGEMFTEKYYPPKSKENKNQIHKKAQIDIKSLLSKVRDEESKSQMKEDGIPYCGDVIQPIKTPPPFDFDLLKISGTIFNTYILASDENCFYLIDQHAAHERIFFEELMNEYQGEEKHRQSILVPVTITVSYRTKEDEFDWMDSLTAMGFSIEEFGPKTYIIKEIPMFMGLSEAEKFLEDYLDGLTENLNLENEPLLKKIIMKSCKSAVKGHDHLSNEEIDRLLQDLKKCENPFSCPHGRPTFIKLSQYEIERMFKRV
ncbi:MAG: DNA mismatch repair endonuclease MutL [Anaerovoracaceae bacterium]